MRNVRTDTPSSGYPVVQGDTPPNGFPVIQPGDTPPSGFPPVPRQYQPPVPRTAPRSSGRPWGGGVGVLFVVLAILYGTGHLDKPLYHVGLNLHTCVENSFGAVFCGDEAKQVCQQFGALTPDAKAACADLEDK